jgi:hypothetical protein
MSNVRSTWKRSGDEGNLVFYDKATADVALALKNTTSVAADDALVWVSTDGDDDYGQGTINSPYLTIAKAFSVVTATRKAVVLLPGEYSSAASIAWPTLITDVLLTGITPDYESTVIKCTAGDEAIDIAPAAAVKGNNFLAFMANLTVDVDDSINGVQIDNTLMDTTSKKLIVTFRDCGFSNETDTDKSVYWLNTASKCRIKMYMHGRGLGGNNIEGLVYVNYFNSGDRCKCNGMNFEGGIQFGTQTQAAEGEFYNCIMKLAGGSGGQATQQLQACGCVSKDGMTYAIAAKGDFATNANESFLSFT